jgi:hypothetical protein
VERRGRPSTLLRRRTVGRRRGGDHGDQGAPPRARCRAPPMTLNELPGGVTSE